jgi:hypothetical protein
MTMARTLAVTSAVLTAAMLFLFVGVGHGGGRNLPWDIAFVVGAVALITGLFAAAHRGWTRIVGLVAAGIPAAIGALFVLVFLVWA